MNKNNDDVHDVDSDVVKYCLDFREMIPGDIILTAGNSKGAKVIQRFTGSHFSHSMIYVGGTAIHAMPNEFDQFLGGVYSKNLQRELFDNIEDVKVLRLTDASLMKQCVIDFCRERIGDLYSIPEAIKTKIFSKTGEKSYDSSQFCSRLVAQAFASSNILLVNNSDYCSPGDFERSKYLKVVPGLVMQASDEILELNKKLDASMEIQKYTFEWLSEVRKLAKEININVGGVNDAIKFVVGNPRFDEQVCHLIEATDYLKGHGLEVKANPFRYNLKLAVEYYSVATDHQVSSVFEDQFLNLDSVVSMANCLKDYEINLENYKTHQLKVFMIHADLRKEMLKQWLIRSDVALQVLALRGAAGGELFLGYLESKQRAEAVLA